MSHTFKNKDGCSKRRNPSNPPEKNDNYMGERVYTKWQMRRITLSVNMPKKVMSANIPKHPASIGSSNDFYLHWLPKVIF